MFRSAKSELRWTCETVEHLQQQLYWRAAKLLEKSSALNARFVPRSVSSAVYYSTDRNGIDVQLYLQLSAMINIEERTPSKYPVPTLRHSVDKFVKYARPLQSDNEYHRTLSVSDFTLLIANEFLEGGEGEKLQNILEEKAMKMENWLTPWFIDETYLKSRNRLAAGTNTAMMFPKWNFTGQEGQIDVTAKIIHAAAKFYRKIMNNELTQEKLGRFMLDMRQYNHLFGSTRIPCHEKDIIKYGGTLNPQPRHIVIIRNGHLFSLSVFDSNGRIRSINQLKNELNTVIYPKSEEAVEFPVSMLTAADRDVWADAYKSLKELNPGSFKAVEDSLFVLCLDREANGFYGVSELDLQAMQCLHGGGSQNNSCNRWFDKTLQFIIGSDEFCGVNFEHSSIDAAPVATMMDYICDHFDLDSFGGEDVTGELAPTNALSFTVPQDFQEVIMKTKRKFDEIANDIEVKVLTFDRFGKAFPRHYGISPDGLTQLAMQLAYYRIHRKQPPTNQATTLRQFLDGRTGTVRLPNFYTSMFTYEMTDAEERPNDRDLVHMMQVATQQHKNDKLQTINGMSMDRHLLGLLLVAKELGQATPEIFTCAAYKKMMHYTILSTQVCHFSTYLGTRHFLPMCCAPSEYDGYNVCYNPQEEEMHFAVATYKSCSKTFSSYRFVRSS
uniref:Carn_acyltransf domain-containing protein n=1 Tax=Syphacia muris TaxID=451379 RepID=A0A0N5AN78_9BILA